MKLYKDGKCMKRVDKDQLEVCLDAGWSKTDAVAVQKAKDDVLKAKEAEEARAFEIVNAVTKKIGTEKETSAKKPIKIRSVKKK